ncbi:MAG TPA: reverse transcriptase domain-containing protein [Acidimicrobiales bacterium]|nr:reverse transcriptase domain-containing protein [Acidimicrobiales bacterium]
MPLQSDLPPAPLSSLAADEPWVAAVEAFRLRHPRRRDRIEDYDRLLGAGDHRRIGEDVLAGRHRPEPPAEAWVNKVDGRKKRVFQYPPADELLFRVVNRLLQPAATRAASPWCRSFLPGGGARAAFRTVLGDRDVVAKAALRLDVRDYFNSIDVVDLLVRVPAWFDGDPAVAGLLRAALLDPRVERNGVVVDGGRKGVMAGTPLAPLLATLYLRELDHEVGALATYARYSDDILVLAPPAELPALERRARAHLAERGLEVNEAKSAVAGPGEPWDFLGFRYNHTLVGLAPLTAGKLKARATRLARGLLRWRERSEAPPERAVEAFFRRTNRRLFSVPEERAEFSWATWFLPMLDRPDGLGPLDEHIQREARYAATGRRTARARQLVTYASMVEAGHLPLVHAYWSMHEGPGSYDALVARRTRPTPPGWPAPRR